MSAPDVIPAASVTPDDLAERKAALRRELRAARRARRDTLAGGDREREGTAIAEAAVAYAEGRGASTVTAYEAMSTEPPTEAMIRAFRARGIRVLMPITLPDLDLDWQEVLDVAPPRGGTAAPDPALGARPTGSPYTLGEPLGTDAVALADVVFTPGLSVDREGRRLGQGGGCYDRALPRRSATAPVVTIVHDDELVDGPLPVGGLDELVDAAITPATGVVDLSTVT